MVGKDEEALIKRTWDLEVRGRRPKGTLRMRWKDMVVKYMSER